MNRFSLLLLSVLVLGLSAQSPEPVDAAAIAKIRDEGLNRSQVMETLFWLTDRYGPRLTGSAEFEEAGDWVLRQLEAWGVQNARKERFAFGRGWSLVKFHATMTEPRVMPIIGLPKAWTPGTNGTFTAEVVRPQIANAEEAEQWRGKLRGRIVLTQPARDVRLLEGPIVLRYEDNPKWLEEAARWPRAWCACGRRPARSSKCRWPGSGTRSPGSSRAGGRSRNSNQARSWCS
jgi:hypothetical protein